jgi:hypothetical protein
MYKDKLKKTKCELVIAWSWGKEWRLSINGDKESY